MTQPDTLSFGLSDSRVWEMVSPSLKYGGILINASRGPLQAEVNGNGLAYQSLGSIEPDVEGNRASERSTVLARRDADGGWHSKDISAPHSEPTILASGNEYNFFSQDLAKTVLEPVDETLQSPLASTQTPYLRTNTEPPVYTPLLSAKEGIANIPPDTALQNRDVQIGGATDDLNHIILKPSVPLTAGAEPRSLYEWSTGGELEPVSILPAAQGGGVVKGILGSAQGSVHNAVSEDGSRVFWSQGNYEVAEPATTALYLRDQDAEETVRIDVEQPGASGVGQDRPVFQGANRDGSIVFFTDSKQLTEDASPEGTDLYRCALSQGADPLECDLTDVTAPRANAGESAEVLGIVSGINRDATKVYFVARGVLDTESNPAGQSAVSGEPNLYLWQETGGARYIATLSNNDHTNWGKKKTTVTGVGDLLNTSTSPSGRYFAFMSQQSLTGYENRDVASGEPDQEVFLYDSMEDDSVCVSCNPSGASPEGEKLHVSGGFAMVDPQRLWQDRWVAAILPQARLSPVFSFYRSRAVLDNGRVFFNAVDSLVAADSNDTWDVYQYQPTGVGDCSVVSGGAATARAGDACVSLISSGTAEEEAGFVDASQSGNDAFFLTMGKLSVLDKDAVYDVYDARVGGRAAALDPVSECAGSACRSSSAPPSVSTPSSEVFRGRGNQTKCPKGKRKVKRNGKIKCVRKHGKHKKHRRGHDKTGRAHR
jgi:hypothetical protein